MLSFFSSAQIQVKKHDISIEFDRDAHKILVHQVSMIINETKNPIDTLYFYAWANAYKNKKTALATRFIENYDLNFHFTREKNRGYIEIDHVKIDNIELKRKFLENQIDILKVVLKKKISPGQQKKIIFSYSIKLPNQKFTGFGIDGKNNIFLKDFYFSPVLNKNLYSNKSLDDMPELPTDFIVNFESFSNEKKIISNFDITRDSIHKNKYILSGHHMKYPKIEYSDRIYEHFDINGLKLDIFNHRNEISYHEKKQLLEKILIFFKSEFQEYNHQKILISENDMAQYPIFGPDLLPDFINPFDKKLLWELEMNHQLARKFFDALIINRRGIPWVQGGLAAYEELNYLQYFYPKLKLIGNLANYKLAKFYYLSNINMREKFPWLYLYMARMNKEQRLSTSLDSLSNINRNVGMPYKSALGFVMLKDYLGKIAFQSRLKEFYKYGLKNSIDNKLIFNYFLKNNKPIDWYKDFINSRAKYDYKVKKFYIKDDSLHIKICNKGNKAIPLKIYGLHKDTIRFSKFFSPILSDTLIKIRNVDQIDMIGVNYFNYYPEIQNKNNFKKLHSFLGIQKPLQIRIYKDFENPMKHQIFLNPFVQYNYYDGVILGSQILNEPFMHNNLFYSVAPSYATKNNTLTGSISFSYKKYYENLHPYGIQFGLNAAYYHYDHGLAYRRINPNFVIKFRDKYLRKRRGSNLLTQFMYIKKDSREISSEQDEYKIFNINYSFFDINIIKDLFYKADLQFAEKFGKISGMFRYRYLSNKNRQWDFRFYAGYFFYNHTKSNYFSFALDRPTDYLFQYNYYGRSESSGIFHQQFIWAEGGFKTFFEHQFANEFIISNNINIGIWKWFNLYGDLAWKKNKNQPVGFYYDSGVRINLVQDYFEVFFPVYSSFGNELKQPNYLQKIRLVFTVDINGLFKMWRRGWY